MMQSRLDRLRRLEAERKRLLSVEKPALEAQWLRILGADHFEVLSLEVDCKRWSAVLREMRDRMAHSELPTVAEVLPSVDAALTADHARLARWRREIDAALDPTPVARGVVRAAADDQPYAAARDGDTAPHVFNLDAAIASLERKIAEIESQPPFTYATLLDDPEWVAEQRGIFGMERAALAARRDAQRQLAELLERGPLG
jgi:uncharacterized protein (DUF2267 family)